MQSKTTRGVRRLLVSAGVVGLVLSVAAPAALAAKPDGTPGKGPDAHQQETTGGIGADAGTVTICHHNSGNGGVLIDVNENSVNRGKAHGSHEHGDSVEECAASGGDPVHGGTSGNNAGGANAGSGNSNAGGNGNDNAGRGATTLVGTATTSRAAGRTTTRRSRTARAVALVVEGDNTEATEQVTIPKPEPEAVIIISADTVTRPTPVVPATPAQPAVTNAPVVPASPAAAPATSNRGNEVLGSVTTRTPNVAGSTIPVTGVTALAATGTSTTMVLAALGTVLLMAGLGLQVSARRRVRSSDVGA